MNSTMIGHNNVNPQMQLTLLNRYLGYVPEDYKTSTECDIAVYRNKILNEIIVQVKKYVVGKTKDGSYETITYRKG